MTLQEIYESATGKLWSELAPAFQEGLAHVQAYFQSNPTASWIDFCIHSNGEGWVTGDTFDAGAYIHSLLYFPEDLPEPWDIDLPLILAAL